MFSSIVSRSTRLARPNFIRRGGHGPVSYNEPSGYLFNEKVMQKSIFFSYNSLFDVGPCKGILGKYVLSRYGRWYFCHGCCLIL